MRTEQTQKTYKNQEILVANAIAQSLNNYYEGMRQILVAPNREVYDCRESKSLGYIKPKVWEYTLFCYNQGVMSELDIIRGNWRKNINFLK